jgi:hypothetical protein
MSIVSTYLNRKQSLDVVSLEKTSGGFAKVSLNLRQATRREIAGEVHRVRKLRCRKTYRVHPLLSTIIRT